MKKLLTLAVLGMFATAIVGCHASADVDSPNDANNSSYKKTTVKSDGGTKTTKTETKTSTY